MIETCVTPWPAIIVAGVLACFVLAGLHGRSRSRFDYGVPGRYTGRIGGGAAIASNWMSAASILGLAGMLYLKGYFALAYVIGWTGGYVLLLVLMAGQIRRFGKYTAPDFVADRYDSPLARLLAALISVMISVIYSIAQFKGIGMLFAWLFGFDYRHGLILGVIVAVSYIVLSGMLGVSRNQQLQYFVMIVSFILPLMFLNYKLGYFWLLPQFGYGAAIHELGGEFNFSFANPYSSGSMFEWSALCFTLMVGTAGLPHVLSRFYIQPNIREARWSVVWGLFFIALIYWSAPAYAVFARLFEAKGGLVPSLAMAEGMADIIVIKTAVMGGVPTWLIGALAAGAVSAAFFTVAGHLITGAASLSHDIYYRIINPGASQMQKMFVAKGSVLILAGVIFAFAETPPGLIAEITAVAFALAGNTIFPVFVLGIWWSRTNKYGVIAGMLLGIQVTFAAPLFGSAFPLVAKLFPLTSSSLCGVPLVMVVIIIVSLCTPPPPKEIRRFLAEEVHGHMD